MSYDEDDVGLESAMPTMPETVCFLDTDKGPSAFLWCWRCGRAGAYMHGRPGKWGESVLVRCLYCQFRWTAPPHVADILRDDFKRHKPNWFDRFTLGRLPAWTRSPWTRLIPLSLLGLAFTAPLAVSALSVEAPQGQHIVGLIVFLVICWFEVWKLPRGGR